MPRDPVVAARLGLAYISAGEEAKAVAACNEALELEKHAAEGGGNKKGASGPAAAAGRSPYLQEVEKGLGLLAWRAHQYEQVIKFYKKVVQANAASGATDVESEARLAIAYVEMCDEVGIKETALGLGKKLIKTDPTFAGGHYVLGKEAAIRGDTMASVPHLRRAMQYAKGRIGANNKTEYV
jgi:tetratricopeptide (TPR) repeat protein